MDVGSRTCKGVIIDQTNNLWATVVKKSGIESQENAYRTLEELLSQLGIDQEDIVSIVATGYGRGNVEFADRNVTEITCHARGAHFLFPEIAGLIDIGGQDSKVIKLDDQGQVIDFAMNDKCAAGTGKFLEVMAETLEVPLTEMGSLAQEAEDGIKLSSICTVFAESEVISHIHQGVSQEEIVAGLCNSVVNKVMSQAERVRLTPPLAMTGGVAKNGGVVQALERALDTQLLISDDPQIVGALGAALLAK
ncbi:MAG: acyl-CoA dehydratase activase [Bacillota bacterium]